jgi:hypothetical protein
MTQQKISPAHSRSKFLTLRMDKLNLPAVPLLEESIDCKAHVPSAYSYSKKPSAVLVKMESCTCSWS